MSRTEWYIVDTRSKQIINCVTTEQGRERAQAIADRMIDGEHLTVTDRPTTEQLNGYRYWNERP